MNNCSQMRLPLLVGWLDPYYHMLTNVFSRNQYRKEVAVTFGLQSVADDKDKYLSQDLQAIG